MFTTTRATSPTRRCNRAGVDLEPLNEPTDIQQLRGLIERHIELTGSPHAAWILEHWEDDAGAVHQGFPA